MASTLLTGLMAYWKMDESGFADRADATASGYALSVGGTTGNMSGVAGKIKTAARNGAAGVSAAILKDVSADYRADADFTIAGWFSFDSLSGDRELLTRWDEPAGDREYRLYYASSISKMAWNVRKGDNTGNTSIGSAVTPMSAGVWYFIVVQWNNATQRTYLSVNNETLVEGIMGQAARLSSNEFTFFAMENLANPGSIGAGQVDEWGFWERILTADEIAELYNEGNGLSYPFGAVTATNDNCDGCGPGGRSKIYLPPFNLLP